MENKFGKENTMNKNIFVVGLDMDNRTPEDIGREAALKVNDIVEGLIKEKEQKEEKSDE